MKIELESLVIEFIRWLVTKEKLNYLLVQLKLCHGSNGIGIDKTSHRSSMIIVVFKLSILSHH